MKFWQSRYNSQIKLSQMDLLEISQKISREFSPTAASAFPELVLLPVDPFHLYAYWNLGQKSINSKANNTNLQLTLRIYWRPDERSPFYGAKQWFDVTVNRIQHQQKVRVPSDETSYSAVIGTHYPDQSFAAYAYSNMIQVPRSSMVSINDQESEISESADETKQPIVSVKKTLADLNDENNESSDNENNESSDNGLSDFIMKDNLYVESMESPKIAKHKSAITSQSDRSKNASGRGANY